MLFVSIIKVAFLSDVVCCLLIQNDGQRKLVVVFVPDNPIHRFRLREWFPNVPLEQLQNHLEGLLNRQLGLPDSDLQKT